MTIRSGARLGPYEIVDAIGSGGMGEVWRARDTRLDRVVAIKVLPAGFAESEPFRLRFEREARTISSLNHPHICTLHDVGVEGGAHYLVMELVEGESVADRLARGPLPLPEVLRYGQQIAAALDAAHRQGVVHRDLKPANVMFTKAGAKLLDFGLAKTGAEGAAPIVGLTSLPTEAEPLTQEGTILGTFQYMAPEQLEGLPADARTDIFALGALLYEMATGRRAFQGASKTSLIAAIVSAQPEPISEVTPLAPPALEHVVRKCLEKDPEDRWQSAHDVASELAWIGESGSQAGVASPIGRGRSSRERLAWSIVALLALLAAALGVLAARPRAPAPDGGYELAMTPPWGTTFRFGENVGGGLVSPDGSKVVFFAESSEVAGLWVRSLDRDDARPIPGTSRAFYPFWSPDSRSIAFFENARPSTLKRIELEGGLPELVCLIPELGRGGTWAEDGTILFGIGGGNVRRVAVTGGELSDVTTLDAGRGESAHYWPQVLGDDRSVLYFVRSSRKELEGIYLGRLGEDGREASRELLVASSSAGRFVAGATLERGHLLWVREGRLLARPLDVSTGELSGEARDLGLEVQVLDSQRGALFSVAHSGTLIAVSPLRGHDRLVATGRDGAGSRVLFAPEEGLLTTPHTSPDGRFVVFGIVHHGNSDLWIHDLQADLTAQLTYGETYVESGAMAWLDGSSELFYQGARTGAPILGRAEVSRREFSEVELPLGLHIAPFAATGRGWILGRAEARLVALRHDRPDEVVMVSERASGGVLSPDERWILVAGSGTAGYLALHRLLLDGQAPALGPAGARLPLQNVVGIRWTRGGQELVALAGRGIYSIPVTSSSESLSFGRPVKLFDAPPMQIQSFSVSPDGERFFFPTNPALAGRTLTVVGDWRSRS